MVAAVVVFRPGTTSPVVADMEAVHQQQREALSKQLELQQAQLHEHQQKQKQDVMHQLQQQYQQQIDHLKESHRQQQLELQQQQLQQQRAVEQVINERERAQKLMQLQQQQLQQRQKLQEEQLQQYLTLYYNLHHQQSQQAHMEPQERVYIVPGMTGDTINLTGLDFYKNMNSVPEEGATFHSALAVRRLPLVKGPSIHFAT